MKRIKILREERKESQLELSAFLGVPQSTLSNWERGAHRPPDEIIFKIADRYGVSPDYLLEYTESREFSEQNPVRLLREYINQKTEKELTTDALKKIDRIISDIISLIASK